MGQVRDERFEVMRGLAEIILTTTTKKNDR
jgi:hypothetical protein